MGDPTEVTGMVEWASYDEAMERFRGETFQEFDFRVRDEWDNGEFLTGATVDLYERGTLVHTEEFVASSEEPGLPSSYFNGSGNHAVTQALSYAWAWMDSKQSPFEDEFAAFGPAWEREQEERGVIA